MATVKQYAYFIKGSKVAIVEKDTSFDNDVNSRDYGPGSDRAQWKSPLADIAKGLEIEYTYAPTYTLTNAANDINTQYYYNGWTIIDGYLCFVRGAPIAYGVANWLTNAVVTGSAGDTGGQTLDYFLVSGSARWNGIHRVQTAGGAYGTAGGGILKTYTKANGIFPYFKDVDLDISETDETIYDGGTDSIELADSGFAVGDFIHISGFDSNATNNGVFTISAVTTSATSASSKLTVDKRYYMPVGNTETPGTEISETAVFANEVDNNDVGVTIAKIQHEVGLIRSNVNVLNDESDEIPVPPYLERAIVDYLKARIAEDQGELEMKEYYLREFRKKVEKHESSKMRGYRAIVAGPHALR
jgi:hypothetical protein